MDYNIFECCFFFFTQCVTFFCPISSNYAAAPLNYAGCYFYPLQMLAFSQIM